MMEERVTDSEIEDSETERDVTEVEDSMGWFYWYWCYSSKATLKAAAHSLMSCVKTPYKGSFVNIGPSVDMGAEEDLLIWTLSFNEESNNVPLVLFHGLASGSALWALNFDDLSQDRPLYAIDLLGFGQSSRPNFSTDPLEAEQQFVNSIEEWRKAMKVEKFILLGHSLGGFLATSYSIKYPDRIQHLILADPWGFKDPPDDLTQIAHIPIHHRVLIHLMEPLNPLWAIRLAGPFGPRLLQKIRTDLIKNFEDTFEDAASRVSLYIFHCNTRVPTGESAFHTMMVRFGWAKFPMNNRVQSLREDIPMTLMIGERSWVDHYSPEEIKAKRPHSYVDHNVLAESGHHVYADKRKEFANIILRACSANV